MASSDSDYTWTITVHYVGGYSLVMKGVKFYHLQDEILKASEIGQSSDHLGPIDTIEVA